jgi:hypothetical protein
LRAEKEQELSHLTKRVQQQLDNTEIKHESVLSRQADQVTLL